MDHVRFLSTARTPDTTMVYKLCARIFTVDGIDPTSSDCEGLPCEEETLLTDRYANLDHSASSSVQQSNIPCKSKMAGIA